MKLHLAVSGGFANLRIQGELDTDELPEELARRAEAVLNRPALEAAAATKSNMLMTDSIQYELTVLANSLHESAQRYQLDESSLADEMLEVLDELQSEIIRRQDEARG
jgi:hypothetical protein